MAASDHLQPKQFKPGERTAKVVHPWTHLHYSDGAGGWSTYIARGHPYEENGEYWVEATEHPHDTETFPVSLHDAKLGI